MITRTVWCIIPSIINKLKYGVNSLSISEIVINCDKSYKQSLKVVPLSQTDTAMIT